MPYLVLLAEAMTVVFVILFTGVVIRLMRESEGLPQPRMDAVGRTLVGSARLALIVGSPLIYAVEAAYRLGLFG